MYNFQCKIYPEKTTFLMALQFVPIVCAQLLYIPYKAMVNQSWFYGAMILCMPYSVARTFIYCPKRNVFDANGNVVFGWKTRHDKKLKVDQKEDSKENSRFKLLKILFQPMYIFCYIAFICLTIRLNMFMS